MARQVDWAGTAWSDLEQVADFIAKDSPYYAAAFVREVRQAADSLTEMAHPPTPQHSIRIRFHSGR